MLKKIYTTTTTTTTNLNFRTSFGEFSLFIWHFLVIRFPFFKALVVPLVIWPKTPTEDSTRDAPGKKTFGRKLFLGGESESVSIEQEKSGFAIITCNNPKK